MSDFVVTKKENQQADSPLSQAPKGFAVSKHPYLTLVLLCITVYGVLNPTTVAIALAAVAVAVWFALSWLDLKSRITVLVITVAVSAGSVFVFDGQPLTTVFAAIGLLGLLVFGTIYYGMGKMDVEKLIFLMIAAGFVLRLAYIIYTDVGVMGFSNQQRQHDVFLFGTNTLKSYRHAEYIEWFSNNWALPSFEPMGLSQFYHPPLHHFIAGLWLRINTLLGVSYKNACENIQILTLFYSSSIMITMYKILRALKLKGFGLGIPMAIICFHPTFIIMAGSVNNDILSVALAFGAVYATIRWYQKPTFKTIIPIALCVGGSMMAKLSGGLIAPAVAFVFLVKLIQKIRNNGFSKSGNLILQFAIFGIICIPLGLFWQVRNYMLFDLPITYVPALNENSGQYLGNYTAFQRLFGFDSESFKRIFVAWENSYNSSFNEYNCLIALIKTSVFGEFSLFYFNDIVRDNEALAVVGNLASQVLFWSTVLLIALFIIGTVICLVKRQWISDWVITIMMLIIFAVVLISYVKFCFEFPQTCTQNFRYAVPLLIPFTVFIGRFLNYSNQSFSQSTAKAVNIVFSAVATVFCVSSAVVYILLGFMA